MRKRYPKLVTGKRNRDFNCYIAQFSRTLMNYDIHLRLYTLPFVLIYNDYKFYHFAML